MIFSFVVTWIMFKDEEVHSEKAMNKHEQVKKDIVFSPLKGSLMPLSNIQDVAFSQGLLGKGIAITPTEGNVVAPFDGTVLTLFPTKHALGVISNHGCEVLIHLGMDTVKLDGKYFTAHVKQGDKVKKGDILVTFDLEAIQLKGYCIDTPIIVTNSQDYLDFIETEEKQINYGDCVMTVLK